MYRLDCLRLGILLPMSPRAGIGSRWKHTGQAGNVCKNGSLGLRHQACQSNQQMNFTGGYTSNSGWAIDMRLLIHRHFHRLSIASGFLGMTQRVICLTGDHADDCQRSHRHSSVLWVWQSCLQDYICMPSPEKGIGCDFGQASPSENNAEAGFSGRLVPRAEETMEGSSFCWKTNFYRCHMDVMSSRNFSGRR